ncbi:MAG: hypothetical protein E7354_05245 [Clostridiales bacterium]|nr:hypothetical protein [Clostridiales bacterium]
MNFNDNQIMNNIDCMSYNCDYQKMHESSQLDLLEILEKLEEQRASILKLKNDSIPHEILSSLDSSIQSLRNILKSTKTSVFSKSDITPHSSHKSGGTLSTNIINPNPYTYTENRYDSISHFMDNNSPTNNAPNNTRNTQPTIENDGYNAPQKEMTNTPSRTPLSPPTTQPSRARQNRGNVLSRSLPQQGNIFAKLLEKLSINQVQKSPTTILQSQTRGKTAHYNHFIDFLHTNTTSQNNNIKEQKGSHSYHQSPTYCYEDLPAPPQPCNPHKQIISRQFDIMRLLLLYMRLKPHSPYCYRVCDIAERQFEILSNLIEI